MQYRTLPMILSEVKGFDIHTTSMTSYFLSIWKSWYSVVIDPQIMLTIYIYISHKNE